ncbi:tropomyosin isoforms c/e-like isoform X2 [Watersipora subatra]|uniref:tropomyosin isoforms c/e-like isoform X2 n=1 Tax=Watersipora subatra TaxID=2589382 RepID=UPI00355B5C6D
MPITGLSAECSAELQGVRGKMLKMRAEAEAATEKAEELSKALTEAREKIFTVEEERNALHRQNENIKDQLFGVEQQLRTANNRLVESDGDKDQLLNEVKTLNHRLSTMDTAEDVYKQQLGSERERADLLENMAAEYKRNVDRLQMDNEKLDHDVAMLRADNVLLAQQLKETEDRVVELTSSYNQIAMENRQLEHMRTHRRPSHEFRTHHEPQQERATPPPAPAPPQMEQRMKEKVKDLEEALAQLNKSAAKIAQLENEVYIYQENFRMLTEQLRELEQVNRELKHQTKKAGPIQDQLMDALEHNKVLNSQLCESDKQNAVWEARSTEMVSRIADLEQQLQQQKAAYGELYSQMNKTITDLEKGSGSTCDL